MDIPLIKRSSRLNLQAEYAVWLGCKQNNKDGWIPGHAEDIMGTNDLVLSTPDEWLCLYRVINSLQDSMSTKSLLQQVSNKVFTPRDLKNVVSFLNTWKSKQIHNIRKSPLQYTTITLNTHAILDHIKLNTQGKQ